MPGSTLIYGSNFCIVTRSPRILRRRPRDEAVRPLPSELATPPVTKTCFGTTCSRLCAERSRLGPKTPRRKISIPSRWLATCAPLDARTIARSLEQFGGIVEGGFLGHATREHSRNLSNPILICQFTGFGKSLFGFDRF